MRLAHGVLERGWRESPSESETTMEPRITREMVLALAAALDPMRQGAGWPDQVAWDGRPVAEQYADLIAIRHANDSGDWMTP